MRQIFDDPAGDHDWGISAEVDLAASDEAGDAVLRVDGLTGWTELIGHGPASDPRPARPENLPAEPSGVAPAM